VPHSGIQTILSIPRRTVFFLDELKQGSLGPQGFRVVRVRQSVRTFLKGEQAPQAHPQADAKINGIASVVLPDGLPPKRTVQ
jgi:hypothetical protein